MTAPTPDPGPAGASAPASDPAAADAPAPASDPAPAPEPAPEPAAATDPASARGTGPAPAPEPAPPTEPEPEPARAPAPEPAPTASAPAPAPPSLKREFLILDQAVYDAVAGTPTPQMDRFLQPLTGAADYSRLWMASAAVLALVGGPRGRRAALHGMASVGLASAGVNQVFKHWAHRPRPDREGSEVPPARQVPMPTSTSFPSGHSASAFAFAEGVSATMPVVGLGLRLVATTVAYTRVHSGVHFPGDVLAGATIGVACGKAAPRLLRGAAAHGLFGPRFAPAAAERR